MESQKASHNLQLELLTLVAFFDKEGKAVRGAVVLDLYDSLPIKNIAKACYEFIDTYKTAPKEHFNEIMGPYLNGKDKELYEQIFNKIHTLQHGINTSYVISALDEFLAVQNLYLGITNAFHSLERNNVDEARKALYNSIKSPATYNDPGIYMSNSLELLYTIPPRHAFTSGVRELDECNVVPGRGELMLIIGLSGKRKSWFVIQMGAKNAKEGRKVLHITLEMPSQQVATRYAMNIMKITSDTGKDYKWLELKNGPAQDYVYDIKHQHFPGLLDDVVRSKIGGKLEADIFKNIVIKHWPSRVLTIPKLETYLDMLEASQGFMPDLMIVDYPEEFHIAKSEDRRDVVIADINRDLRRIAEERHMAVVAPSQSNRGGAKKEYLGADDIAEAYGKIPISDVAISVNVTDQELKLGLMRLKIIKNREGRDYDDVIISNLIDAGQVAMSSAMYYEKAYKEWIALNGDTTLAN